MAYCHGEHSPYGCGHHAEHIAAARLGWMRRHSGKAFEGSQEQRWLQSFAGGEVRHAHTHRTKRGTVVMFKHKGKWFEVSRSSYRDMLRAGREMERDEQRERRRAEAEQRRLDREHASAEKKAAARARAEAREREAQERMFRRIQTQERAGVVRAIREIGGIRSDKVHHGEWATLPASIRNQTTGKSLDAAREHVQEHFPWLGLHDINDLLTYFDRVDTHRRNSAHQRKAA